MNWNSVVSVLSTNIAISICFRIVSFGISSFSPSSPSPFPFFFWCFDECSHMTYTFCMSYGRNWWCSMSECDGRECVCARAIVYVRVFAFPRHSMCQWMSDKVKVAGEKSCRFHANHNGSATMVVAQVVVRGPSLLFPKYTPETLRKAKRAITGWPIGNACPISPKSRVCAPHNISCWLTHNMPTSGTTWNMLLMSATSFVPPIAPNVQCSLRAANRRSATHRTQTDCSRIQMSG